MTQHGKICFYLQICTCKNIDFLSSSVFPTHVHMYIQFKNMFLNEGKGRFEFFAQPLSLAQRANKMAPSGQNPKFCYKNCP